MKNKEKGFALPVALLLLVVMTLMGATLVSMTASDIRANDDKDKGQQAFYAAESGIAHAKRWMKIDTNNLTGSSQRNLNNDLKFCKTSLFPNLVGTNGFHREIKSLNEVISASGDEQKRLSNFSFEWFVAYSPNQNGNNSSPKKKPGTNKTYYTIYSCGCDGPKNTCRSQNNKIVALEAVVTLSTQ
mgnify:FL=1